MIRLFKHLQFLFIYISLASSFQFAYAQKNVESEWVKHVIKPPRSATKDNTVPSMVRVHDVDKDGPVSKSRLLVTMRLKNEVVKKRQP